MIDPCWCLSSFGSPDRSSFWRSHPTSCSIHPNQHSSQSVVSWRASGSYFDFRSWVGNHLPSCSNSSTYCQGFEFHLCLSYACCGSRRSTWDAFALLISFGVFGGIGLASTSLSYFAPDSLNYSCSCYLKIWLACSDGRSRDCASWRRPATPWPYSSSGGHLYSMLAAIYRYTDRSVHGVPEECYPNSYLFLARFHWSRRQSFEVRRQQVSEFVDVNFSSLQV